MPPALDIAEEPPVMHLLNGQNHVGRTAGVGVNGYHGDHIADLEIGVDLMADLYGPGACYQLVMAALVHGLFGIGIIAEMGAAVGPAEDVVFVVHLVVDLIEGHPVFYFVLVALKANFGKLYEEVNGLPVHKPAVLFGQMVGHLKMGQGDNRLNAVF